MGEVKDFSVNIIDKTIQTINKNLPYNPILNNDNVDCFDIEDGLEVIPNVEEGYNLLIANNLSISKEEIESVTKSEDNKALTVILKDGREYCFELNNDTYELASFTSSNGIKTELNGNYDGMAFSLAFEYGAIDVDAKIKGVSEIEINGKTIYVYWVEGDNSTLDLYEESLNNVYEALNGYPDNVLDEILSTGFETIIIGPKPSDSDSDWAAYASLDNYIYYDIESTKKYDNEKEILEHELAHILDVSMASKGDDYSVDFFTDTDPRSVKLYKDYRKTIQEIGIGGYAKDNFPDGIPNVHEFFAKAVTQYLECPEELEALMPEVYDYIDDLFNNLK